MNCNELQTFCVDTTAKGREKKKGQWITNTTKTLFVQSENIRFTRELGCLKTYNSMSFSKYGCPFHPSTGPFHSKLSYSQMTVQNSVSWEYLPCLQISNEKQKIDCQSLFFHFSHVFCPVFRSTFLVAPLK